KKKRHPDTHFHMFSPKVWLSTYGHFKLNEMLENTPASNVPGNAACGSPCTSCRSCVHSFTVMPSALMTSAHFWVSASMMASYSSGVVSVASIPDLVT